MSLSSTCRRRVFRLRSVFGIGLGLGLLCSSCGGDGTNNAGAGNAGAAGSVAGGAGAAVGGTSGGGTGGTNGGAAGGTSGAGTSGAAGAGTGGLSGAATGGTGDVTTAGTSGASMGGTSGGSTGGNAGATGGSGGSTPRPSVQVATSIPQVYRSPHANAGQIVRRSYPCYHYTEETAGINRDPRALVLERRQQAITKEFNIYLPYAYSTNVKYPIIYVLHGITDNHQTWLERGNPHPGVLLDNLIARGDIEPVVAVFPNGNSSSTFQNRDFSNQAGYYYFANELVNDLIPFIEQEYSVRTDRNSRALCGFSMGGMQTINAGLCQSLEHFSWFGAFAAAPSTYSAMRIAEYLGWENEQASYPINYFYNVVGASDSTARASHEGAVSGVTGRTEALTDRNFAFHTVPGSHDYPTVSVGLYNLLRIAFPK